MKSCENCVYEYTCDWTPAEGKEYCENWRPEQAEEEER